jgi:hypothetical protein
LQLLAIPSTAYQKNQGCQVSIFNLFAFFFIFLKSPEIIFNKSKVGLQIPFIEIKNLRGGAYTRKLSPKAQGSYFVLGGAFSRAL